MHQIKQVAFRGLVTAHMWTCAQLEETGYLDAAEMEFIL